jgi:hypothetical protein
MIIVTHGDGREEHYTYPADGRFHVTPHGPDSLRSFLAPGPAYSDVTYHPLARIEVPVRPDLLARPYRSSSAQSMTIPCPTETAGVLEIGILGGAATHSDQGALAASKALVRSFAGPRSDTTIVCRYHQGR